MKATMAILAGLALVLTVAIATPSPTSAASIEVEPVTMTGAALEYLNGDYCILIEHEAETRMSWGISGASLSQTTVSYDRYDPCYDECYYFSADMLISTAQQWESASPALPYYCYDDCYNLAPAMLIGTAQQWESTAPALPFYCYDECGYFEGDIPQMLQVDESFSPGATYFDDYCPPDDEPSCGPGSRLIPIVGMMVGPTNFGGSSFTSFDHDYECETWLPPCEINPNFPICQPPDEPEYPELPPEIITICYEGETYVDVNVAGANPDFYTVGPCPIDEEPTEPVDPPVDEAPAPSAPPPASAGSGGLVSGGSNGNAWTMAGMTLALLVGLGGTVMVTRRR